ncbi:hypothetical protein SERLA73DRAFT_68403 [Serpula lacrymans var. lacrymans S7.3]|uniref:Uncharacterized protein n=1 Tax=Serpula lacrymans var. lacrymans (strain S7.3) TaxID=936435 RepID=F8PFG7_SERL3|nr:hypothetical protein SERLA73DRAFT_68403 [Serpula lacrymans var. lacrymans S7.3]
MPASDAGMTIGNPESLANLPTSDTNLKVTAQSAQDKLPLATALPRLSPPNLPSH